MHIDNDVSLRTTFRDEISHQQQTQTRDRRLPAQTHSIINVSMEPIGFLPVLGSFYDLTLKGAIIRRRTQFDCSSESSYLQLVGRQRQEFKDKPLLLLLSRPGLQRLTGLDGS